MSISFSDQKTSSQNNNEEISSTNFEISPETKACYYAVRKKQRTIGRIELPGLFDYADQFDKNWTIAVLIVEIIALFFLTVIISESSQDIPLFFLGLGAFAFLLFDFILAWSHHFVAFPYRCKNANNLLRVFPSMRAAGDDDLVYRDYCKQLKFQLPLWRKLISWLSVFLIFILAAVKFLLYIANVGVFFENTQMPPKLQFGINGLVFLSYFFCGYAHIFHTGYYLAYRRLKKYEERDKKAYFGASDRQDRKPYQKKTVLSKEFSLVEFVKDLKATSDPKFTDLISSNVEEQLGKGINTEFKINKEHIGTHGIEKKGDKYRIIAHGFLTDNQLEFMATNQESDLAKAAIGLWGHYIQVESLKMQSQQSNVN